MLALNRDYRTLNLLGRPSPCLLTWRRVTGITAL